MGLEKQDRIDRYIREEMTSAEREAFERDLKADQALSGLYEESRLIAHAIRDVAADRELMAIMRNASADEIRSVIGKERRSRQRWLWWAIGSVAALLLVAVVMRITLYTSSSCGLRYTPPLHRVRWIRFIRLIMNHSACAPAYPGALRARLMP